MAELDVQRKKSSPWWLWLLIGLVVLALIFFFLRNSDEDLVEDDITHPHTGSLYTPAPALHAGIAPTTRFYAA